MLLTLPSDIPLAKVVINYWIDFDLLQQLISFVEINIIWKVCEPLLLMKL
jgi:hypothetical protein